MKRLLAAVIAVAVLAMLGTNIASAGGRDDQELKFRTTGLYATLAATDPRTQYNYIAGTTAGYIDSSFASGIAKFDTTAWISTRPISRPPASGAGGDSSIVLSLHVYDAGLATVSLGKTSATAESLYVEAQGSADQVSWQTLPVISSHTPVQGALTVQTTVNANVNAVLTPDQAGNSTKQWVVSYGTTTYRNADRLCQYPFIRFVIYGSRSLNHSYKAALWYWKD